ncbi:MAG: cupin [Catenulispora sp.]|nr:cupin [Catenulispora sp.]
MNPNPRALRALTDSLDLFQNDLPTRPLLAHLDAAFFQSLLRMRDIDELLADQGLRYPLFSMSRNGGRLAGSRYTYAAKTPGATTRDLADLRALRDQLAGGATLILDHLHRTWRPLADFCRRLSHELSRPVGANAYLTPPAAQGFGIHYDTHGAFIVQVEGRKTWDLYEPLVTMPLEDQRWQEDMLSTADRDALREAGPTQHLELVPGDVLWLPRGWLHDVFTTDEASLHLTIGIPEFSKHMLAAKALAALAEDEEFRAELPLDALTDSDRAGAEAEPVLKSFAAWLLAADPAAVGRRATELLDTVWYPARSSPIAAALLTDEQISAARGVVTRREAVRGFGIAVDGKLQLRTVGGEIAVDAPAAGFLGRLLEEDDATPVAVAEYLEGLGGDGSMLRSLLGEGVAELMW